ncbi:MAG: 6-carboxytetrahydropterin synthase [Fuerstiella sp.]|nr:6-carboxytetrahydropterin synthase [Fuerstiella sp.]
MIIEKQYKFYAAHRNETLRDKCSNIHGHRYGLKLHFEVERDGDISTLFGDFDAKIEPWLRQQYDHGMLINRHDPLYIILQDYCRTSGEHLRFKVIDGATSVENLAWTMFSEVTEMGFRLARLEIQETDTSNFLYTRADWTQDNRHFAERQHSATASRP